MTITYAYIMHAYLGFLPRGHGLKYYSGGDGGGGLGVVSIIDYIIII